MAKTKKNGREIAVVEDVQTMPSYITNEGKTGLENLGKDDFAVQRIKLLAPLSPEVRSFPGVALPTEFWHTGANKSLGIEFFATPIVVNKRVIVFPPQDAGNDDTILAVSRNGVNWDSGASKEFKVKLKGSKKEVIWKTGKDVRSSGLLNFGTSDPEDSASGPAATIFYEYLMYLHDHSELSPVVLSAYRTAVKNALAFNTFMASRKVACYANKVRVFSVEQTKNNRTWNVVNFQGAGWAPQDIHDHCKKLVDEYSDMPINVDVGELRSTEATESTDI